MIFEVKGDLLAIKSGIIAHQVNCRGVMGAGIARQIRKNLLTDEQYGHYQNMCRKHGKTLLGKCFIYPVESRLDLYVANLFGENIPTGRTLDTDYQALRNCFMELGQKTGRLPVYIPGYIGCGLAGGNWDFVYGKIIQPLFWDSPIRFHIIYSMDSIRRLWGEFGDVPMNPETETLEEHWHCFPAGIFREKVWEWFEETFDLNVVENLMYG